MCVYDVYIHTYRKKDPPNVCVWYIHTNIQSERPTQFFEFGVTLFPAFENFAVYFHFVLDVIALAVCVSESVCQ